MATHFTPAASGAQALSSRDYISFSALSTFQTCPLRYQFRYVLGMPEETVAASLVLGSAIHAAMEHHFREMLAGKRPPDLDTLLEVFQDSWRARGGQRVVFGAGEDVNTIGRLADRMLRVFQASALSRPQGTVIGVEEELRGPLLPGLPDLLVRMDLIVDQGDSLLVTDFKTTRSAWSSDHVEAAAAQLLLYHELAKDLADGRPVRLAFALLTKTKFPDLVLYPVAVSPQRLERTKRVVERIWRAIEVGSFFPRPSPIHCPTCPFRTPCRAWTG
jgi:CRISPR/Cas system-associated exonuclease Cas4 (RecB family)